MTYSSKVVALAVFRLDQLWCSLWETFLSAPLLTRETEQMSICILVKYSPCVYSWLKQKKELINSKATFKIDDEGTIQLTEDGHMGL